MRCLISHVKRKLNATFDLDAHSHFAEQLNACICILELHEADLRKEQGLQSRIKMDLEILILQLSHCLWQVGKICILS